MQGQFGYVVGGGVVIGPGVTRIRFIKRLTTKYPRLGNWGRALQRKLAQKNIHI